MANQALRRSAPRVPISAGGCPSRREAGDAAFCRADRPAWAPAAGRPQTWRTRRYADRRRACRSRQMVVPAVGKLAMLHFVELIGQRGLLLLVGLKHGEPGVTQIGAARADPGLEMLADAVRHQECGVLGPAVVPLGQADLLRAERLAVGRARALLGRRAVANVAIDDDQRRASLGVLEAPEGARQHGQVVGITHTGDVPAVRYE